MDMPSEEEDAHYRAVCSRLTLQGQKEGFFKQLADGLASNVDFGEFLNITSDKERFKIVANACWDKINAESLFRGKNEEVSVQKRLEGNKYFENNDHKKALLCYSQSLVQAPVGPELISSYTNRSALLFKIGEYQAAIDDAELAISYGSLEETKHKLYERMTSCYISLKNYKKAKVTAKLAKHLVEKHDPTNEKFFQKLGKHSATIDKALKDSPSKPSDQKSTAHESLPEGISFTPGNVFSHGSDKFAVKYAPDSGRFAIATANISPGEVVLCEEPYAAVLKIERMGSHCTNCFIRFKVPIPCETCSHVAFCSRKCRKEAQDSYHQYECKTMALMMGSGMSANAYLALRIITQSSVNKFKEIFPDLVNNPVKVFYDHNEKFDTTSYQNIYNLGGLEQSRSPVDFYERTFMSVFLTKCLRLNQYFQINLFQNPKPTEDEFMIGSLILRNLQVIQFNAYEVCEFLTESKKDFKKTTTASIGIAIYSTSSYFNHSCAPDVTRYFKGKTLMVQTIKGIAAGKPICDNYGPMFTKMERKARLKQLSGRYWFACKCVACLENWPLLKAVPAEIEPKTKDEKRALKKLQALDQLLFDEGMKAMEAGKPLPALHFFRKFVEESETILRSVPKAKFCPYKPILLAQEGMKLCLCGLGSVHITGD